MAELSRGYTFGATEIVTAAKLHLMIDSGGCTNIVASDIANLTITEDKIVNNTLTSGKIHDLSGAKFTNLGDTPAAAGVMPAANLTSVAQKGANSDITSLSGLTTLLSRAQGGLASNVANNAASGVVFLNGSSQLPAVSGALLTNIPARNQFFTSSGTFTAPTGVSYVFVSMVGAGGGGGGGKNGSEGGGGGGSGAYIVRAGVPVVATTGYTVTINAAGTAGAEDTKGGDGGTVTFAYNGGTLSCDGGGGGGDRGGATGTNSGGLAGTVSGSMIGGTTTTATGGIGGTYKSTVGAVGGDGGAGDNFGGGGGAASPFGLGGAGATHNADVVAQTLGYGSGGGGGAEDGATSRAGAAGRAGFVLVEW